MKKFVILYCLLPYIISAAEVTLASKHIKFGEIFNESDILHTDISDVDRHTIISDKPLIAETSKVNIETKKSIKQHQLRPQPVIRKNDQVVIMFVKDNIKLQGKGIALENGFDNSTIKVKNLYNSKNLIAKVVDSHSVSID